MEVTDDVRQWVSRRAAGVVRLVLSVESLRDDTEGALRDGDLDYAAYSARELVLYAMSIASLAAGGEIDFDVSHTAFDWFDRLDDELLQRGRGLALELAGRQPGDPAGWLARLSDFLGEIEERLDLGMPVPRLRSPDGMFASLALTRDWLDLCAELGGPVAAVASGG